MDITRSGDKPSGIGPEAYFTGRVRIDPLATAPDPGRLVAALVTFEPGARTAWHTHRIGQTLIVTAGLGWVCVEGGARQEIRPGDVVSIPAGESHWHGATDRTGMSHIALQERQDGETTDWLELVSDEDYGG